MARSVSTSCPGYPSQSPCKITSFWSRKVFCTENQSAGTEALILTAAFRRGGALREGMEGQTRTAPAMSPGGRTDLTDSRSLWNRTGNKRPFCLSGLLVRVKVVSSTVLASESTFQQTLNEKIHLFSQGLCPACGGLTASMLPPQPSDHPPHRHCPTLPGAWPPGTALCPTRERGTY